MKKNDDPVLLSVKSSIRSHKAQFLLMIVCIIGSVISALLPPLVLERGVDLISEGRSIPLSLALLYLALIVVADMLEAAQDATITILGQNITRGLRSSMCRKLDRLPTRYFKRHESGMTASVFVNDADTIDSLYSDGIVSMIADSFKIISILIVVFMKSPGLGLLLLFVTPFLFLLTRLFQKRTLEAQTDNRRAIARINNHVPETIRNIRMIHVFGKEKYMADKYDRTISESYDAINRSNIYDSIYSPIILMTQALVIALMMIFAARGGKIQNFFGLTAGSAVAIIAYVGKIFSPLESLGMEIQNIQSAVSGIRRINEFLLEEEWNPCGRKGNAAPAGKKTFDISFSHVTFGYTEEKKVLKDLSFDIKEGENVTFMGRTGSGKTTVFNLVSGLYEPDEGTVCVSGRDPLAFRPDERREIYGIVEQKFNPLPGSVREQLRMYDDGISDEMVIDALKLTGLWKAVDELPQKLDTDFEDSGFSQGQLQLLAIARAVVTSPKILLLDEITANLDSVTEADVLAALKNAAEGRTVLSISHRFSEVMKDERIIMIGE